VGGWAITTVRRAIRRSNHLAESACDFRPAEALSCCGFPEHKLRVVAPDVVGPVSHKRFPLMPKSVCAPFAARPSGRRRGQKLRPRPGRGVHADARARDHCDQIELRWSGQTTSWPSGPRTYANRAHFCPPSHLGADMWLHGYADGGQLPHAGWSISEREARVHHTVPSMPIAALGARGTYQLEARDRQKPRASWGGLIRSTARQNFISEIPLSGRRSCV